MVLSFWDMVTQKDMSLQTIGIGGFIAYLDESNPEFLWIHNGEIENGWFRFYSVAFWPKWEKLSCRRNDTIKSGFVLACRFRTINADFILSFSGKNEQF